MSAAIEGAWPYVASVVWLLVWYFLLKELFPAQPASLLAASGTAAAVLVGFLATSNAILLSLVKTDIFQLLVKGGFTSMFHRYCYEAIVSSMAFLVISIVGFFLSNEQASAGAYPIVWMLFGTLSFFLFVRINHLLFSVVSKAK